jgi:hypothetical protein
MQLMIAGQSHFQPFGLSYWGFADLNKGVGGMTACYDYHIGSRTPLCDRSQKRHQGHALENGSEPKDSKSDLSGGKKDYADRCEMPVKT